MAILQQLNGRNLTPLGEIRPAAGIFVAMAEWWAVDGKTVLAAYRAKGAASQAAAKINLANPGVSDLTVVTVEPGWNATDGFVGSGGSGAYDTGILSSGIKTGIVRVSNLDRGGAIFGIFGALSADGAQRFGVANSATEIWYQYGGIEQISDPSTSGVYAVALQNGYKNGSDVANIAAGTGVANTLSCHVMGYNYPTNPKVLVGNIQAIALYSDELTAGEIAALTTRMAAL